MNTPSIECQFIPIFEDNYIWLIMASTAKRVIAVDPGDADPLLSFLKKRELELDAILITHHHFDHTHGIQMLKRAYNVPVYGPNNPQIMGLTHHVKAGDVIHRPLLNITFGVLHIPGHTLDHIAYTLPGAVFCGDTLFSAGCGRLFEGTPAQMYHSLQQLANLADDTKVYCTHEYTLQNLQFAQTVEPNNQAIQEKLKQVIRLRQANQPSLPSVIKNEKEINPFLRCQEKDVIQAVEKNRGFKIDDPVDVFRYLRQWKDGY